MTDEDPQDHNQTVRELIAGSNAANDRLMSSVFGNAIRQPDTRPSAEDNPTDEEHS